MACDFTDLSVYLDGELPAAERQTLEAHLEACPTCRRELERLDRVRAMLSESVERSDFHQQLMRRIETEAAQRLRRPRFIRRAVLVGAVCLVVAIGVILWMSTPLSEHSDVILSTQVASPKAQVPQPGAQPSGSVPAIGEEPDLSDKEEETEPAPDREETLQPTELPLILSGTTSGPKPMAVITVTSGGEQKTFAIGDTVLPGVEIVEISRREIVLDNNGIRELLTMDGGPPAPTLPPIDGLWASRWGVGDDVQDKTRDVKMGEQRGVLVITDSRDRLMAQGRLSGNHATLDFQWYDEGISLMEGDFNDARTEILLKGEHSASLRPVTFELSKITDAKRRKKEMVEELKKQVKAMYKTFRRYTRDHEGRFPEALASLVPDYTPNLDDFADTDAVTVRYYPGGRNPSHIEYALNSANPDLSRPDQLMAVEQTLKHLWGDSFPSKLILEVTYADPAVVFTCTNFGHIEQKTPGTASGPAPLADDPDLRRAQLTARRESCQNNLKQLGIVCKIFQGEHGDYTPPGWYSVYPEYLVDVQILTCPGAGFGTLSYELIFPATHIDYLKELAGAVSGQPPEELWAGGLNRVPLVIETHEHPGDEPGRNVLFADGHAEFIGPTEWVERIKPYLNYR